MTTTTDAHDRASSFDDAAERLRSLSGKLIETAKKYGGSSLDAYEQALSSSIELQRKTASATQLPWVNTLVKAQTDFAREISAIYTGAAREALK